MTGVESGECGEGRERELGYGLTRESGCSELDKAWRDGAGLETMQAR